MSDPSPGELSPRTASADGPQTVSLPARRTWVAVTRACGTPGPPTLTLGTADVEVVVVPSGDRDTDVAAANRLAEMTRQFQAAVVAWYRAAGERS